MYIQVIEYPEASLLTRKPLPCEGRVFRIVDELATRLPQECRDIGDAFVGDNGDSGNCGRDRVEHELRTVACRLDADIIVVRAVPDSQSDCFQARARLLRCPAAGPQ